MTKDTLKEAFLQSGLNNVEIIYFDDTDSTNTRAKEYARAKREITPTVFVADRQTAGRGRMGRSFASDAGVGLYYTLLLAPADRNLDFTEITVRCAVAVRRAILSLAGAACEIKWVNDLFYEGRKLAGILAEGEVDSLGNIRYAAVGVGINVRKRRFEDGLFDIATTVEDASGKAPSRSHLAAFITRELLSPEPFDSIMREYRENLLTLGKAVTVRELSGAVYSARAVSLTDTAALTVELADGSLKNLISADVSVKIN